MPDCELKIHVTPRAKREEVVGERAGLLSIKLTAAPVKGAANKALVAFLAEKLDLPRGALAIIGGATSREKRVRIVGLDEESARARLLSAR
jgi:hypothetical protein